MIAAVRYSGNALTSSGAPVRGLPLSLTKDIRALTEVLLLAAEDPKELERLLKDLFTPSEVELILKRWNAWLALVSNGDEKDRVKKKSLRRIAEELKCSEAVINKAKRVLNEGTGAARRTARKHLAKE